MEVYNPTNNTINSYRSIINQSGSGVMDRFIWRNQDGEGIGSFFGNLFRSAIPILSSGIKGAATLAKPHLKRAAIDIVNTGSKRAISKLSNNINRKVTTPKNSSTKKRKI